MRDGVHSKSAAFVRLSHLRKLCECEQVAAVCYRLRGGSIEFLLVRTRSSGRWTFPKGSAEPGLTHAQAAALEAFEEAGVHGRIEEASFARYFRRRHADRAERGEVEFTVKAYLCEGLGLHPPQELDRRPTWFSAEKAMRRVRDDRAAHYGAELVRIVESAVKRIQRVHPGTSTFIDSAQVGSPHNVHFIDRGAQANARRRSKPG